MLGFPALGFSSSRPIKTLSSELAALRNAPDRLRRRPRLAPLPEEAESGDWEELEERLIRSERREAVRRALGRLSGEYRQVLILSYFEGFGNEETAKVMKKTRRQVENLLYRAKQSLKAELLKEGISDEDI